MHGTASVDCERCGSQMKTTVGSRYSQWMSTYRDDSKTLLCSDCKSESSEPNERRISMDIEKTSNSIEFSVKLLNPTIDSVGFSLKNPTFEDEEQWQDTEPWSKAAKDSEGTVGYLVVMNENEDIVLSHQFKSFFSSSVPSGQMIIGEESSKEFSLKWNEKGRLGYSRATRETNRYCKQPTTKPTDHRRLTAVFILKAIPRNEWEYRRCSESIVL